MITLFLQRDGYNQREIADYFGLYYTTVSRIMNEC
ncbi:MAG: hypothetical protein LLF86_01190 [Nitrospiraceae bacterium]|nr:hypothetical protein [Nitrospiraceae bacterium]